MMTRQFCIIAVSVLLLCVVVSYDVFAEKANFLLEDDFSKDTGQWEITSERLLKYWGEGKWEVKDGVLSQTMDGINCAIFAGDETWADYILKARVRISDSSNKAANFYFRSVAVTTGGHYSYRLNVSAGNNQIVLAKETPGGGGVDIKSVSVAVNLEKWHEVLTIVNSDKVTVYFNKEKVIDVVDPYDSGGYYKKGRVGLYCGWSRASFDDIYVYPIERLDEVLKEMEGEKEVREPDSKSERTEVPVKQEVEIEKVVKTKEVDHLSSAQFEAEISRETGMLISYVSLLPVPVRLASKNKQGLHLFVENLSEGWIEELNQAQVIKSSEGITYRVGGKEQKVVDAEIHYGVVEDRLACSMEFRYLVDDDRNRYRIGFYQDIDSSSWPEFRAYGGGEGRITQGKGAFEYMAHGDMESEKIWYHVPHYPVFMPFRGDRTLIMGNFNLASYVVMAYNIFPDSFSFFVQPKQIKKGQTWSYQVQFQTMAAPLNTYSDAVAWWAQHMYYTDEDMKGESIRLNAKRTRTIPEGNVVGVHGAISRLSDFNSVPTLDKMEENMLRLRMTHMWFADWADWRETWPSKGKWTNLHGAEISAEILRDEIRRLKAKGINTFLYFRQGLWFLNSELALKEECKEPPYKRWLNRRADGTYWTYWSWATNDRQKASPTGFHEDITGVLFDFGNDEARAWYTQQVINALKYYQPAGVAWDMGWTWAGTEERMLSTAAPNEHIYMSELKMMNDVYKWIQKNAPEMRVIGNFGGGMPMSMVTDAELYEGAVSNINQRYYFEATRAHANTPVQHFCIFWPQAPNRVNTARWILAGLGLGASWSQDAFSLGDHDPPLFEEYKPEKSGFVGFTGKKVAWLSELTEIAAFSAKCNAVPAIQTTRALKVNNDYSLGAVWADERTFLGTVFYQGPDGANPDTGVPLQIKIDRRMVEENGFSNWQAVRARVYGADAIPKGNPITPNFKLDKDTASLEVSLKPGELLTLFSQ